MKNDELRVSIFESGFYKIDHYYSTNNDETAFFIKTNIPAVQLGEIIACIQFKFEELVDESMSIADEHLKKILVDFYGVEDVTEEFQRFLPYTKIEKHEWRSFNDFDVPDSEVRFITQIDQYHVRESCCGPKHLDLMNMRLPEGKDFVEAIMFSEFNYIYID